MTNDQSAGLPPAPAAGTGVAPPAAAAVPDRRTPFLAYDVVRLGLAVVLGAVVAAALAGVLAATGSETGTVVASAVFAFSSASSLCYVVHTLWVFVRTDPETFRRLLVATAPRSRLGRVGEEVAGTGPTVAVQWSLVAVAAVLAFTVWPGLLREPLAVILSILVVAASWAVTNIAYAVHYARIDQADGGLQFPDDKPRLFVDFLYLAVQVQTTFSTSDVSLLTPRARSVVTGHTLISFAFNTVIIAMLITVLFIGGGAGGAS